MPKFIDGVDIPVRRVNRTTRLEVMFDATGAVTHILAHRLRYIEQGGVSISPPAQLNFVGLTPLSITPTIQTALNDLEAAVDFADTQ